MALSDVGALTFDVFGTVVNWRDSIAREAKAILEPKGYDKDWHDFADKWRARYQPAMAKVRNGERPWAATRSPLWAATIMHSPGFRSRN